MRKTAPIHLFFIPFSLDNSFCRTIGKLNISRLEYMIAVSGHGLQCLLRQLPPNKQVILWIHARVYHQDASGSAIYFDYEEQLRGSNIISSNAHINFFTTGGLGDSIKGSRSSENTFRIDVNGHSIYEFEVFKRKNRASLPASQSIRELSIEPPSRLPNYNLIPSNTESFDEEELKAQIGEELMRKILGTCFSEDCKDFYIELVKGGFSGSILLKVTYTELGIIKTSILKIQKNEDDLVSEYQFGELKVLTELSENFIDPIPNSIKNVEGWLCIKFPFRDKTETFEKFVKENIDDANILMNGMRCVLDGFTDFERKVSRPHWHNNLRVWSGTKNDSIDYYGLKMNDKQKANIYFEILKKVKTFKNEDQNKIQLDSSDIHALLNFVKQRGDCRYKNKPVDSYKGKVFQKVPVAIVHGDFNPRNILISKDLLPVFIDFANVPSIPNKHAFLDLGKLSSELEIAILEFGHNDIDLIHNAIVAHKTWMNIGCNIEEVNSKITAIYNINSQIRTALLFKFEKMMSKEAILHQFYLVRVHYFLKAISYSSHNREKTLFLVKLCTDTLDHVISKCNENH